MRSEELYLNDILQAADDIQQFLEGCNYELFVGDEMLRSAVLWKLTVIGEGAAHVSEELRQRYPEIAWDRIVGARNVTVHGYFGVNWERIWNTATGSVPVLRSQIETVIRTEFGGSTQ